MLRNPMLAEKRFNLTAQFSMLSSGRAYHGIQGRSSNTLRRPTFIAAAQSATRIYILASDTQLQLPNRHEMLAVRL